MDKISGEFFNETAKKTPVYGSCDVLVIGGGPGGTAAAIGSANTGADTVLVERYGHLGGLATGGHVCWIDRMSDWNGHLVVGGVGQQFMELCGIEPGGIIGPEQKIWGSHDSKLESYWNPRSSAHKGIVTWAPTIDPETLKFVSNDLVRSSGVHTIFHCWAVGPILEKTNGATTVRGVLFESKEGRFAIRSRVTIDCTGDGDIFAAAGADFETNIDKTTIHSCINTSCRFGGINTTEYWEFRDKDSAVFKLKIRASREAGIPQITGGIMPRDGQVINMKPKYHGYSAITVSDLTEVEFRSRDDIRKALSWWRGNMPGWKNAYVLETADQIGVRHSRRLVGETQITMDHWRNSGRYPDSIGLCPGISPDFPTLEIPIRSLIPRVVGGIMVAGRNLSCDVRTHQPLREIPECWVMGHGAGIAAAMAIEENKSLRKISIPNLQKELLRQEAIFFY